MKVISGQRSMTGNGRIFLKYRVDIARRIANELKSVLSPEEEEAIKASPTKNPEAYDLYLQGRLFWYMRTKEALEKSVEYFNKAISSIRVMH